MCSLKRDTAIRREQITQAAVEIVAAEGVRRLSVAAVAQRVGLVPSGIYRHFRSKDEILSAVLDLLERRMAANVQAACAESANPLEQLRGILMRHIALIRDGRAIPRLIFSDDAHAGHPQHKARVRQIIEGYLAKVRAVLARGQEEGLVRSSLDLDGAEMLFVGMVVPAAIRWHLTDGQFDVVAHGQRVWQIFLEAIASREPASSPSGPSSPSSHPNVAKG